MGDKCPSWIMSSSFPALKRLKIYNARNLTEWPESGIMVFPCLEELLLMNCDKLRSAPSHFPSLKKLEIYSMGSSMPIANISNKLTTLTSLTISNIRGLASLPKGMLKNNKNFAYLEIEDCQELTRIAPDVVGSCAFLESVCISKCPILAYLPNGLLTTSLKNLIVKDCDSLELIPVTQALPSLYKLEIKGCPELSSLPIGLASCSSLEVLRISNLPNLESIPSLDNLTNLHELEISCCDGLKSLPSGLAITSCLNHLKSLKIGGFWKELDSFPAFQVTSQLETLKLRGWPKLKSLPEQIQHLTSLTRLNVQCFDGMEALPEWLKNLTSLEYVEIHGCKNLMYLPTLEAMQCLTKLKHIITLDCPLLKESCNKKSGSEWPKISHIPLIYVNVHYLNSFPVVCGVLIEAAYMLHIITIEEKVSLPYSLQVVYCYFGRIWRWVFYLLPEEAFFVMGANRVQVFKSTPISTVTDGGVNPTQATNSNDHKIKTEVTGCSNFVCRSESFVVGIFWTRYRATLVHKLVAAVQGAASEGAEGAKERSIQQAKNSSGGALPRFTLKTIALLFFFSVFWGFYPLYNAVFTFPQERRMLIKERSSGSGMYRLSSYFLARTVGDLALPTAFVVIIYWMGGLKPDPFTFILFLLVVLYNVLVSQSLGLATGAILMDIKQATNLASITTLGFLIAGGYYIQQIPAFIVWLKYLSYVQLLLLQVCDILD
ncbi:unnamed protein product [Prunus armeniaca]|uniref:Uncharacterized protein n=1 Tax=Prunus armeniaca TaxID=36596 RepID=A0A6J5WK57_PRUAR|nr:unnamed protein product [Prunus armeniaca]